MSACTDLRRDLEAYLALDLAPEREAELRAHLADCLACREAVEDADPAALLGIRLGAVPGPESEDFVAAVMSGVRERSLEAALSQRRGQRRWLVAAVLALGASLGGWLALDRHSPVVAVTAAEEPTDGMAFEPAFVEVEGEGVRVYELTPPGDGAVRVAFIVDPGLEI